MAENNFMPPNVPRLERQNALVVEENGMPMPANVPRLERQPAVIVEEDQNDLEVPRRPLRLPNRMERRDVNMMDIDMSESQGGRRKRHTRRTKKHRKIRKSHRLRKHKRRTHHKRRSHRKY
jgi:hypothetical protein